jgi:DNA-binding transcriptional LysR family regulator
MIAIFMSVILCCDDADIGHLQSRENCIDLRIRIALLYRMTDLSDLETFVAVAGLGSFAAAARRLGVSPAMVGRRVQALEDRYGAKLIERTTRSLRLTDVGTAFLEKSRQIMETVDELDDLTRPDASQLSGRIRVTGPTTLGIKHLARIIARLSDQHPGLEIELSLSDRSVDLIAGGFDLAIRIGELPSSAMIARRVGTYRFACCAAPEYLSRNGMPKTPDDLADAQCVLNLNLVPRNRWPFFDPKGKPFSVDVRGQVEIDNGEALRAAALAGAGIIYVPQDLVADDLASGALVAVLGGWRTIDLPIHTLHPTRRLVPRRVTALIDAIHAGLPRGSDAA